MSFINNTANFNQGILGIFFSFEINDNSVVRLLLGNKNNSQKSVITDNINTDKYSYNNDDDKHSKINIVVILKI